LSLQVRLSSTCRISCQTVAHVHRLDPAVQSDIAQHAGHLKTLGCPKQEQQHLRTHHPRSQQLQVVVSAIHSGAQTTTPTFGPALTTGRECLSTPHKSNGPNFGQLEARSVQRTLEAYALQLDGCTLHCDTPLLVILLWQRPSPSLTLQY
jgi:hypothetical protein